MADIVFQAWEPQISCLSLISSLQPKDRQFANPQGLEERNVVIWRSQSSLVLLSQKRSGSWVKWTRGLEWIGFLNLGTQGDGEEHGGQQGSQDLPPWPEN